MQEPFEKLFDIFHALNIAESKLKNSFIQQEEKISLYDLTPEVVTRRQKQIDDIAKERLFYCLPKNYAL